MQDDFESLLEQSFEDPEIMELLWEKKNVIPEKQLPLGEVVKDYPAPQRELDLHGKISSEAMRELEHFIGLSVQHRIRTVRIVTGKGLHSKNMVSVLPEMAEKKLAELRRAGKVLAFKRDKTGGAFLVYLVA